MEADGKQDTWGPAAAFGGNGPQTPSFSRTPERDIFGKLDDELSPIRINSDALLAIKRKAADNGMSLAEYVRTRLYVDVFGLEHVLMLHENRIRRATTNASQGDPVQLRVVGDVK